MAAKRNSGETFDVTAGFDFSGDADDEIIEIQPTEFVTEKKIVTPVTAEKKTAGRPKGSVTKKAEEKAQHFSTSLPPDVIDALKAQAEKEDRAVSKVVARAIKFYIENN